jgi:hypothetical protein
MKKSMFVVTVLIITLLLFIGSCDGVVGPPEPPVVKEPPTSSIITACVEKGSGMVEPQGEMEIDIGTCQAFIFKAGDNQAIDRIEIDGEPIQGMQPVCYFDYVLCPVDANHTVQVSYRPAQITQTVYNCSNLTCPEEKTENFYPNFGIVTESHKETYSGSGQWVPFYEWRVRKGEADIADPTSIDTFIERICGDASIYPYYWYGYYRIRATCSNGGEISPSGDVAVQPGHDQLFYITTDQYYVIAGILTSDGYPDNVNGLLEYYHNFNDVNSNKFIYAEFRKARLTVTSNSGCYNCQATRTVDFEPDYPISTASSYKIPNYDGMLYFSRWVVDKGEADIANPNSTQTVVRHITGDTEIYAAYNIY